MKGLWWISSSLLLCLSSCLSAGVLYGQQPSHQRPPKNMRLCETVKGATGCLELTWASEYYEARQPGQTKIDSRYWITGWDDDGIDMNGKTAFEVGGGYPLEIFFKAPFAADGAHVSGSADWRVGYNASGSVPFSMSWKKDPSNVRELYVGEYQSVHYSKSNPNVILPPGASETFVSYPVDVRAFLQPDYPLLEKDAMRKCHEDLGLNEQIDLEIARYSYRAGDLQRGHCFAQAAASLGSERAMVLRAIEYRMGWNGPKDEVKAFETFKLLMSKRDPWDILFLYNCYVDGTGTEKNVHEASILTSYTITHNDTLAVMDRIGSDDESLNRQKARLLLLMDPPTKSETHCSQSYTTAGGIKVPGWCDTQSTVDHDAVQKRLNEIEAKM
jgi:hypothetical protein